MPDNSLHRTMMATYLTFWMSRAWDKAVRGVLRSMMISTA